jgi:hypothetical protein
MASVATMKDFDASKVSFGDPVSLKLPYANMTKIPVTYDGKALVLQTPIFADNSMKSFQKKTETDKDARVIYMKVKHQHEKAFIDTMVTPLVERVQEHIKQNSRELFDRKVCA